MDKGLSDKEHLLEEREWWAGWFTWLPQISWMVLSLAYSANACAQNWMAALVASSTSATLNKKSFIRVAPGRMGRTVISSSDSPTLVQPLIVTAACKSTPESMHRARGCSAARVASKSEQICLDPAATSTDARSLSAAQWTATSAKSESDSRCSLNQLHTRHAGVKLMRMTYAQEWMLI